MSPLSVGPSVPGHFLSTYLGNPLLYDLSWFSYYPRPLELSNI
jgi:hypothetical protein